jgi:probable F420-dependent oxidoreductase
MLAQAGGEGCRFSSVKFGVWIPNCRHLATPDIIRTTAVRAEALGYDSVWVSDHVVVPHANVKNFGEAIFDPLITLGVAAGATRRVQLGTTVLIVPYRHAVVTAKMVSTLDALSGGRVVFGVGAGWVAAESAMLGLPFAERGAMTDEYLRAMRELWTSPAPTFAGKYTQFSGLVFEPRPIQKPHPPIWVGGHSKARCVALRTLAAAWHPINRPVEEPRAGQRRSALPGARATVPRSRCASVHPGPGRDRRTPPPGGCWPERPPPCRSDQEDQMATFAERAAARLTSPPTDPAVAVSLLPCDAAAAELIS